jgi:hypothetical protein
MKSIYLILLIIFPISVLAQQKNIPLENYYKKEFLRFSKNKSIETFFPANENQLHLRDSIKDSTIFYYDFPVWFFQKNWIEIKQNDGHINISPLINLSFGKANNQGLSNTLYRNTRGVFMEGELLNKFSYNFIFAENQAVFSNYEAAYFNDRGEYYVGANSYSKVNAVIPSGARTKPFKNTINAYDYAFSIGSLAWQVNKKIRLETGNNQHFIGVGHRSLLLSDNSTHAPYVRLKWKISNLISYQFLSRKQQNLFRKPSTKAVESAYEKKLFTAHYLTFQVKKNFSIAVFTSGNQLRADSIIKHPIMLQQFVPFINNDLFYQSKKVNGISGINLDYSLNSLRTYAQVAIDKIDKSYLKAFQVGIYYFDVFKIKNLDYQTEFNFVPDKFYSSSNEKLAYSNSNLPLGHTKGNNFKEIINQLTFEWKRMYSSFLNVTYFTKGATISEQIQTNSIFIYNKDNLTPFKGFTTYSQLEFGYRINKKYNPTLYFQIRIRNSEFETFSSKTTMIMTGLKVNLFNQYLDF